MEIRRVKIRKKDAMTLKQYLSALALDLCAATIICPDIFYSIPYEGRCTFPLFGSFRMSLAKVPPPFQCVKCGKQYNKYKYLRAHMETHSGTCAFS